ncbi:sodium- and chloride-dependent glycine transporter 1-like isoform X2 [Tachypleus tridentatus]|uniref:sodium- and chloride-dependent glycine transporter 1-like isoform X2 n=1 Tax=Tachypleus tridentatus TaxID=6853 RepID=UPI003FD6BF25
MVVTTPATQSLQLLIRPYRSDGHRINVNEEQEFPRVSSQVPLSPKEDDDDQVSGSDEEGIERGNWTGRFDFILSLLGYSVGLGNIWRFPYLCYSNGGGAFVIPFIAMMMLAGLPLMFMELAIGQYANLGPVVLFQRFCPLFQGLGYGMILVSSVVMLYYNVIIAWTLFYTFASWARRLPWENCDPEWSTNACYSYQEADACNLKNGTYFNQTCFSVNVSNALNLTELVKSMHKKTPADEYFLHYVLGISNGIEETGEVRWSLALCLLLAWVIVFACLSKGVQSSGKVVYFTALFPYVVLIIMFFRGVTLPGAKEGILWYITPEWSLLGKAQVWGDAAVQIFFALSPAWGGLITLSSYNPFHNNCYKDAIIVSLSNVLTSIFAGFVIFSVIGYLAHELNVEVEHVVDQGAGLAFIVYPEVVARLPIAPLWAFLFFIMLLTLGLDSQFALLETVTTAILDSFPFLREKKTFVVLGVSIFGFLGGIIFTTRAGVYWLELFDKYAANFSVLLIAIAECLLISWNYGADRFLNDIEKMIGPRSNAWVIFWSIIWKYLTPATLLFILFFNWIEYEPAKSGDYIFPAWANAVGWIIAFQPVVVIIGVLFWKLCSLPKGSLKQRFIILLTPREDWGPAHKHEQMKNSVYDDDGMNGGIIRENSFDNPNFNVTYTFETAI